MLILMLEGWWDAYSYVWRDGGMLVQKLWLLYNLLSSLLVTSGMLCNLQVSGSSCGVGWVEETNFC